MSSQIRVAAKLLGAILLVSLALFCQYGFLASYELGFPNVWHAIYGVTGVAAVITAVWLGFPALKSIFMGTADRRLAALFSLFSLLAFPTGNYWLLFHLAFLFFLIPEPAKKRTGA
jgi:hypothetical protein